MRTPCYIKTYSSNHWNLNTFASSSRAFRILTDSYYEIPKARQDPIALKQGAGFVFVRPIMLNSARRALWASVEDAHVYWIAPRYTYQTTRVNLAKGLYLLAYMPVGDLLLVSAAAFAKAFRLHT
jgi:hypothetical protein